MLALVIILILMTIKSLKNTKEEVAGIKKSAIIKEIKKISKLARKLKLEEEEREEALELEEERKELEKRRRNNKSLSEITREREEKEKQIKEECEILNRSTKVLLELQETEKKLAEVIEESETTTDDKRKKKCKMLKTARQKNVDRLEKEFEELKVLLKETSNEKESEGLKERLNKARERKIDIVLLSIGEKDEKTLKSLKKRENFWKRREKYLRSKIAESAAL